MKSDSKNEGRYDNTLFCAFPRDAFVIFSTDAGSLDLQTSKKSVISYRMGCEPSVYAALGQYTFSTKVYCRYTFEPKNACLTPIEQLCSALNKEV
jgi:hypothetical protein